MFKLRSRKHIPLLFVSVVTGLLFILFLQSQSQPQTLRVLSSFTQNVTKPQPIRFLQELQSLGQHHFSGFGDGTIPRIVHITYKSVELPTQYENYLRHCVARNADVAFLFWTDEQADEFVKQQTELHDTEDELMLSKILSSYRGIEKADVLRLMLLYFLGGIYMDLDTECRTTFSNIHLKLAEEMRGRYNESQSSSEISCMLDQEQWLQTRIHWSRKYSAMNNLMICRPRHPFLYHILKHLKEDDHKTHIMYKTGPFMLTKYFEEYNHQLHNRSISANMSALKPVHGNLMKEKVELAHPNWFSPIVDHVEAYENKCRQNTGDNVWIKEGCNIDLPLYKKTIELNKEKAFLIHWFLHLGYEFNRHLIKRNFSVHTIPGIHIMALRK